MVDHQYGSDSDSCDSEGNQRPPKPEFKSIPLQRLDIEVQLATDRHKYCLIFDKSSAAQTFFAYKSNMKEFHKEVIACSLGKKLKS